MENLENKARLVVAVVALLFIVGAGAWNYASVNSALSPWYDPIVTRDEVKLALWADGNIPPGTLYAADLFACEMLTATARAVCSVGGAWELADNANQRFSDNEKAFLTNSSKEAWELNAKYGVKFVLTSPRTGFYAYGYKQPQNLKWNDSGHFQLYREEGQAKLYKVVYGN